MRQWNAFTVVQLYAWFASQIASVIRHLGALPEYCVQHFTSIDGYDAVGRLLKALVAISSCVWCATASFADQYREPRLATSIAGARTSFSVALSSDGSFGVLAGLRQATIVDARTGLVVRELEVGPGWTYGVAVSPDGRFIATGATDGLKVFAVADFSVTLRINHPEIEDVRFSADGRYLAAGARDGLVSIWRAGPDWKLVATLRTEGPLARIAISDDGSKVAAAQGYNDERPRKTPEAEFPATVSVWSVQGEQLLWAGPAHKNDVAGVAFADQGQRLITAAGGTRARKMLGPSIHLWNADTGELLTDYGGIAERISDLGRTGSSTDRFYVVSHDGSARSVMTLSGNGIDRVCRNVLDPIDRLAASRQGENALGISAWGKGVFLWKRFAECNSLALADFPLEYETSARPLHLPERNTLLLPLRSGLVGFDTTKGEVKFRLPQQSYALAATPDANLFASLESRSLVIRNSQAGTIQRVIDLGHLNRQFENALVLDEAQVVLAVRDPSVRRPRQRSSGTGELILYDATQQKVTASTVVHDDSITALVHLKGENTILTSSWDGTIKAIDSRTLKPRRTYFKTDEQINALAISPDGRRFAAGWTYEEDGSGTVGVWSLDSEQPIWRAGGPEGIDSVDFSKDGSSIIAAGDKKVVELYADTGRRRKNYEGIPLSKAARYVSFGGSGSTVVAVTQGGEVFLWDSTRAEPSTLLRVLISDRGVTTFSGNRFDVSRFDDLRAVGWVADDDPIRSLPFEIFMRTFYEPKLFSRLVGCSIVEVNRQEACEKAFKPVPTLSSLNRVQPEVRIVSVEPGASLDLALVTVEVAEKTDVFQKNGRSTTGVYDVRVFRSGQLVGQWPNGSPASEDGGLDAWRRSVQVEMPPGMTSTRHVFPVRLGSRDIGKKLTLTAYAFNEDRVKSSTASAEYLVPQSGSGRSAKAFVISIGVNAYEKAARDLQFAVSDAKAMASALSQLEGYDVVPITLTSAGRDPSAWRATKSNIRDVLALLAGRPISASALRSVQGTAGLRQATPDDVVVITFSGHGYTARDGAFYFLPSDSGTDSAITREALSRFISAEELSEWLRPIDAGQMALIIDACHSAASVEQPDFKPGPMGDRGFGQLAYDKAMMVLAASQADNVALESEKLKQGLLTYALVHNGLAIAPNGKRAADRNRDGKVTLAEWLRYGEEHTPVLLEDIKTSRKNLTYVGRDVTIAPEFAEKVVTSAQTPVLFDFARVDSYPVVR